MRGLQASPRPLSLQNVLPCLTRGLLFLMLLLLLLLLLSLSGWPGSLGCSRRPPSAP
jgi:hypothetical protein